jgi:D-lactate dehydrogenase
MSTIVFAELEPWEKEFMAEHLNHHELLFFDEPLSAENVHRFKSVDIAAIFIFSKMTSEVLSALPRLRLISTMSTGFDHVDLEGCRKRAIVVSHVPAYGENTVAEHTFALILSLTRKIVESVERTRRVNFELTGLRGRDLQGKTLGVVGTGKIGRNVVRIARGFGMRVLAYDAAPSLSASEADYVSFEELLARSDIVTFHVPLNSGTRHMLNRTNIGTLKRGALLINTARGGVVETAAIIEGLRAGILGGAGLDVLEEETGIKEEIQVLEEPFQERFDLRTLLAQHVLLSHPNVYITPHSAFYSIEALQRIMQTTVDNITGFLRGKPINVVSPLADAVLESKKPRRR